MRFAFMTFSTPDLTLDEVLELAAELGYDGIEPRLDAGHAHGVEVDRTPAERKAIARTFADSGVTPAALATSSRFADPALREEMIEATLGRIDLAADVGARRLRVFGGAFPEGVSRAEAIDGVAGALSALADRAAERDVTICMETHDAWCDPAHVAEVMRRVDHPHVAVNWDVLHPVRQGLATVDESYAALRPWVRHLHVHDGLEDADGLRIVALGAGCCDHRRAVELLAGDGYEGFLSGEWINWEPYQTHLPRELATMRRYRESVG